MVPFYGATRQPDKARERQAKLSPAARPNNGLAVIHLPPLRVFRSP